MRARRALDVLPPSHLQGIDPVVEQFPHVLLASPKDRRERSRRRRRRVACEGPEELRSQALGRERQQSDRASGSAHAKELVGDPLMIGGEHRAERGGDDVERPVVERERLGVGLDPLELDPAGARFTTARLEVLRREVGGNDLGAGLGGPDRHVSRARGHVEHTLAGSDTARLHEHGPELPHCLLCEPVVVAERPHRPLGGFVLPHRLCRGHALGGHASSYLLDPGESRNLGQGVRRSALHTATVPRRIVAGFATNGHPRPPELARIGYTPGLSSSPARTA